MHLRVDIPSRRQPPHIKVTTVALICTNSTMETVIEYVMKIGLDA